VKNSEQVQELVNDLDYLCLNWDKINSFEKNSPAKKSKSASENIDYIELDDSEDLSNNNNNNNNNNNFIHIDLEKGSEKKWGNGETFKVRDPHGFCGFPAVELEKKNSGGLKMFLEEKRKELEFEKFVRTQIEIERVGKFYKGNY
jgi:hypothetical protein